jgi:hypothetical protein
MYVTVCCEFSWFPIYIWNKKSNHWKYPCSPYIVLCGDIGLPGSII